MQLIGRPHNLQRLIERSHETGNGLILPPTRHQVLLRIAGPLKPVPIKVAVELPQLPDRIQAHTSPHLRLLDTRDHASHSLKVPTRHRVTQRAANKGRATATAEMLHNVANTATTSLSHNFFKMLTAYSNRLSLHWIQRAPGGICTHGLRIMSPVL